MPAELQVGLGPFPRTGSALRALANLRCFPAPVNDVFFSMKAIPGLVSVVLIAANAFAQASDPLTVRTRLACCAIG